MNLRSMIVVASVLIPLCGCGGLRTRPVPGEETRLKVPYVADRREQWGPAAVADVMSFWGRPVDLKAVRRGVRFTRSPGDVALDLQTAGANQGFKADMSQADLATIKSELDAGRPVIALVNVGFSWAPVRGYMVVTGYSDHRGCVYAHWGPYRDFYVSYRQFETDWRNAGNWLLRIDRTEKAANAVPPPPANTPITAEGPKPPDFIWFSP